MKWSASAPSNIALIKYMGKESNGQPVNSSLSYTLNHLQSYVEIEEAERDSWEYLSSMAAEELTLSREGIDRFMAHFSNLRTKFSLSGNYTVRSANTFPSDCGLASSASSFAALTLCFAKVLKSKLGQDLNSEELSLLSQKGSGSSCRSFFQPWAIWEKDKVYEVDLPFKSLLHQVLILNSDKKKISSSQAHKNVQTSLNFQVRPLRAEERLKELLEALKTKDWKKSYEITWEEFQDMHNLFETSCPPFGYISPEGMEVLNVISNYWQDTGDGPIVTMDAGPNIHLLYREDQSKDCTALKNQFVNMRIRTLSSSS